MSELRVTTASGRAGLDALLADAGHALVAFDFDGTLSPIVDDPKRAYAQPGIVVALARLASRVGQLAIVTGRPATTAVALAALDDVPGLDSMVILGQYGLERWEASTGVVVTVPPPPGLETVRAEIADVIAEAGVADAVVEDKGLALAVHVRRSASPAAAYQALLGPLLALAARTGLVAEPGRLVIELRPEGMDKGKALRSLATECGATTVMFTGDDLGDLAAFDAVDAWRADGGAGLLVCSGSEEVDALASRADLIVDGPPGVLAMIDALASLLT